MYKKTWLLMLCLLCGASGFAQNLVSATFLGQKTKAQLQAEFDNLPFIQYGAKYYRITYTTKSVQGALDTASGLLAVPDQAGLKFPRLVYQHGTSGSKTEVPSINVQNGGEGIIGKLFAGLGYVSFLPDYLGLGLTSKGFHPYVHAASEVWAAMDMLRAGTEFLEQNQIEINDQLFVTGYSQGGHGAMALARAVELDPAKEFELTAAAPMSGPYSVSQVMRQLILTDAVYYYPGYIPNTALSYQTVYGNLFGNLDELFKPAYVPLIQQFYTGTLSLSDLNEQLIAKLIAVEGACRPFKMLQPAMIQAIESNPDHPINQALRANDTYNGWIPKAPLRLYYCMADDQVPYQNSLLARDSLVAAGAQDFSILDVMSTADHGVCVKPALTGTVIFFLGLQQIETVGTSAIAANWKLGLSPNPASTFVQLNQLPFSGRFEILDLKGKRVQSGELKEGSSTLTLSGLTKGIYLFRFLAKGEIWTQKLIVG